MKLNFQMNPHMGVLLLLRNNVNHKLEMYKHIRSGVSLVRSVWRKSEELELNQTQDSSLLSMVNYTMAN